MKTEKNTIRMKTNKRHISFPSIEQFRNIVSSINRTHNFIGLDSNGDAIYDTAKPKPILTFKGTVKLHGTNAGVCFNNVDGFWAQSRENIITPQSDNAGFAFFAETNKNLFMDIINKVAERSGIDLNNNTISVYGEWAGGNIQKGVGICNLPKSFFIFGVKVSPFSIEGEEKAPTAYWVDYTDLRNNEARIYNIDDFEKYSIEIDFNRPETIQNKLIELTLAVEEKCPVADAFGFVGIGEGIVWSTEFNGTVYRFKVKGEKHAGKSKVPTLKKVDDEKIKKIIEVAERVTPTWRLSQMIEKSCDLTNGGELDRAKLGEYLKMVMADVIKEDLDILAEANLEPKDVSKYVSDIARRYFFEQENV